MNKGMLMANLEFDEQNILTTSFLSKYSSTNTDSSFSLEAKFIAKVSMINKEQRDTN